MFEPSLIDLVTTRIPVLSVRRYLSRTRYCLNVSLDSLVIPQSSQGSASVDLYADQQSA
jgi:hypothetical protein